jgi:hypothetical protein
VAGAQAATDAASLTRRKTGRCACPRWRKRARAEAGRAVRSRTIYMFSREDQRPTMTAGAARTGGSNKITLVYRDNNL